MERNNRFKLGGKKVEGKLLPIQMDRDVALKEPLEVIRCNGQMGGETALLMS